MEKTSMKLWIQVKVLTMYLHWKLVEDEKKPRSPLPIGLSKLASVPAGGAVAAPAAGGGGAAGAGAAPAAGKRTPPHS